MTLSLITEHVSEDRVRVTIWNGYRVIATLDVHELATAVSRFDVQLQLARGERPTKLLHDFATMGVEYEARTAARDRP